MISVCIATYNGEKYIREQLDSILCQLSKDDEIIISDDHSTDGTISIINSYNDSRIHLFNNQSKRGVTSNFENALSKAVGDYIFLSDQDDVWLNEKVEKCIALLKVYDLVVHNAELIDGTGNVIGKTYFSTIHHGTGFFSNLLKPRFLGCCMCFNQKVLKHALPLARNRGHDFWIGMIALFKRLKVTFDDDVLIKYRRHENNFSSSSEKSGNSFVTKLRKRCNMIYELTKRCIFF